ncbi:MAG: transglutaminase domain-containing protein [Anaerolineaceae bacterium]|nr:transglutaminase domain-containing protein [Anaerolineaceae bacterium]
MKKSRPLLVNAIILAFLSAGCQLFGFLDISGSNNSEDGEIIKISEQTSEPLISEMKETPSSPEATVQVIKPNNQQTETITATEKADGIVYEIVNSVTLFNEGPGEVSRLDFTMAIIHSIAPYQEVLNLKIHPQGYKLISDRWENDFAFYRIKNIPVGESILIEIRYEVKVFGFESDLSNCKGFPPSEFLEAEDYIEVDHPKIQQISSELADGVADICALAEVNYDYTAELITYAGYNPDEMGALAAINQGRGDCTEFSDVLTALNRAGGIPTRWLEGVICCTENGYDESEQKHNWIEFYLPNIGWVPADPTWGRYPGQRDDYYAKIDTDHIILTKGRNLDTLNNYHYFSYYYWWDNQEPSLDVTENWSILKSE